MNKKILFILVMWGMLFSSCTDWLDVTPENSIEEADLFKEATGFQNALNGVYEQMASTKLYGKELSFGMLDAMGRVWCLQGENFYNIKNYHYYYQAGTFAYDANDDIKEAIDGVWSTAYTAIANCNNIISNIDKLTGEDFRTGEPERLMIKGEALAARAWLHFDLLRMFAPAPRSNPSGLYIPYVKEFPYYGGQTPLTVEETMEAIEVDLKAAQEMIMAYDTLDLAHRAMLSGYNRFKGDFSTAVSGNDGSTVEMLPFYYYRGYRINALAVTGLMARFYSYWGGDKHSLAAANAQKVVDFLVYPEEKRPALEYVSIDARWNPDFKFSEDLIFCLSYPTLMTDYTEFATSSSNACLTISKYDEIWNDDFADAGDYRLVMIYDDQGDYMPLKNVPSKTGDAEVLAKIEDMVPMIRMSEMHFVLAEYYASIGQWAKAAEFITKVRVGRNCDGSVDLGITDMETFKARLLGEVRREFFAEGQTFFYYKKYGEKLIKDMNLDSFVVPTPDSENIH